MWAQRQAPEIAAMAAPPSQRHLPFSLPGEDPLAALPAAMREAVFR